MRAPDGTVYDLTGEGPPVVLVHGFGLDRHMWQWLLPDVADFRVLSYDLTGHGESPDPAQTPSLMMFGEQILRLMDHCGIDRAAIAGFSLGGMIARRFVIDHADRVSALAILNSAHDRTSEDRAAILKRVEQARASGPASTVEAALERWFTAPFREAHPEIMDRVRAWVRANRPAVYPEIYRVLAEGDIEIAGPIRGISCPTLVMTGEEDYGNSPEMTRRMAEAIPESEAMILPGLRHMGLAEDPRAFNAPVVGFLKRHLAARG
jgi:pimeloyl-ACP methyl ester carboxylesterase